MTVRYPHLVEEFRSTRRYQRELTERTNELQTLYKRLTGHYIPEERERHA